MKKKHSYSLESIAYEQETIEFYLQDLKNREITELYYLLLDSVKNKNTSNIYNNYLNISHKIFEIFDFSKGFQLPINLNPPFHNTIFSNDSVKINKTSIEAGCLHKYSAFLRNNCLFPNSLDFLLFAIYTSLIKNNRLNFQPDSSPWGTPYTRKYQTLLSITDPGDGHLLGTLLKDEYLEGVIIHIEHLERGVDIPRSVLEPYRIPDNTKVKEITVRKPIGVPSSTYIGRADLEGELKESFVKSVHLTSSSCSNFFKDGITECKIALENKSFTEIVKYLKAVSKLTIRDKSWQIISAAFCINEPIIDDRNIDDVQIVSDRFAVGKLAIEIVKAAGIEKVTWDGTQNEYPSYCILEQLGFENALTLVHLAHEQGLLCYFSAGFRFHHIKEIVYTGVDGVGLGGAQLLRYMDKSNGNHGPFIHENVEKLILLRNEAESDIFGQSATILAKLDFNYHKKIINEDLNKIRIKIYDALCKKDEKQLYLLVDLIQDFSIKHKLSA